MTEQPFPWRDGPRVRRIGVSSARLKASSGYALTRIVEEGAGIVRSLEHQGHPFARPAGSAFYRFLDGVLLEVWASEPEEIPTIFGAMFVRNPADRVLRFLDQRAGPWQVLRLVATLPKRPFVHAVVRWMARRSRSGSARGPAP
jgi:lycopene beta-cyclase